MDAGQCTNDGAPTPYPLKLHLSYAWKLFRYVDKNRYQTKMSESIIDTYAFPGSSVYAPLQRDGRFPDSRPKGKGIETEHFVPSAMAGIQALEEYLPKRLLETSIKVLPVAQTVYSVGQHMCLSSVPAHLMGLVRPALFSTLHLV